MKRITETTTYRRSNKLRQYAIDFYTVNGKIFCKCCSFCFEDFYGKKIGGNFIEIHHLKPIYQVSDEKLKITIENAVKKTIPVCSNCHRMIHRNRNEPLEIKFLKKQIRINGKFCIQPVK